MIERHRERADRKSFGEREVIAVMSQGTDLHIAPLVGIRLGMSAGFGACRGVIKGRFGEHLSGY